MWTRLVCLILTLDIHAATAMAAGKALTKALGSSARRPVIVHVYDRDPDALEEYAIDEVSEACRKAGATAMLVTPALVRAMAQEQEAQRGNFPGPVPVIADCALSDMQGDGATELVSGAKALGAAGIGIRYYLGDWPEAAALEEALTTAVAAAEQAELATVLLGEFGADGAEGAPEGASDLASRVGAAAALLKDAPDSSPNSAALGCWDGTPDALERLKAAGFSGLILKDACRGNVALGARVKSPSIAAQLVTRAVKAALSKGSKTVWGGAGRVSEGGSSSGGSLDDYFNQRGL